MELNNIWMIFSILGSVAIIGNFILTLIRKKSKKNITQTHKGMGDNVGGNKTIYK